MDYYQGGAVGGGKPTPILEPEQASFFIVRAATQRDLAISTTKGEWYAQRRHAEQLNEAYKSGRRQVMTFFTVSDSLHIQGAALMTSMATYQEAMDTNVMNDNDDDGTKGDPFCYRFKCEWYRTVELMLSTAVEAAPDLLLPTSSTHYCLDMTSKT
eukprot:scaffold132946_cov24-Attheya_sp.AAC.1